MERNRAESILPFALSLSKGFASSVQPPFALSLSKGFVAPSSARMRLPHPHPARFLRETT